MRVMLTGILVLIGLLPGPDGAPLDAPVADFVEGTITIDGRPASGAVVYLEPWKDNVPDESRSFADVASADTVILDQRGLRFLPGTLAVRPGTTVLFLNNDYIQHNVFSPDGINGTSDGFDLGTYARGETRFHTFSAQGAHTILCNVHPEMLAYVVSVPAEFKTVTDSGGSFTLVDVPSGPYLLRVWHPKSPDFDMALQVGDRLRPLDITLEPGD